MEFASAGAMLAKCSWTHLCQKVSLEARALKELDCISAQKLAVLVCSTVTSTKCWCREAKQAPSSPYQDNKSAVGARSCQPLRHRNSGKQSADYCDRKRHSNISSNILVWRKRCRAQDAPPFFGGINLAYRNLAGQTLSCTDQELRAEIYLCLQPETSQSTSSQWWSHAASLARLEGTDLRPYLGQLVSFSRTSRPSALARSQKLRQGRGNAGAESEAESKAEAQTEAENKALVFTHKQEIAM